MSSICLESDVQGRIFDFSDCMSAFRIIAVALQRGYAASHQSATGYNPIFGEEKPRIGGVFRVPKKLHPRSSLHKQEFLNGSFGLGAKVIYSLIGHTCCRSFVGVLGFAGHVSLYHSDEFCPAPCADFGGYGIPFARIAEQIVKVCKNRILDISPRDRQFVLLLDRSFEFVDVVKEYVIAATVGFTFEHECRLINTIDDPIRGNFLGRATQAGHRRKQIRNMHDVADNRIGFYHPGPAHEGIDSYATFGG